MCIRDRLLIRQSTEQKKICSLFETKTVILDKTVREIFDIVTSVIKASCTWNLLTVYNLDRLYIGCLLYTSLSVSEAS